MDSAGRRNLVTRSIPFLFSGLLRPAVHQSSSLIHTDPDWHPGKGNPQVVSFFSINPSTGCTVGGHPQGSVSSPGLSLLTHAWRKIHLRWVVPLSAGADETTLDL